MRKPAIFVALAIACTGYAIAAQSAAGSGDREGSEQGQTGNAGMNAMQDRTYSSPAEALYVEHCAMCHRQFGMGTVILARRLPARQAMLEDRDNLAVQYVVTAARFGIGNMPRIPRGEVSDDELNLIAGYLAGKDGN